MMILNDANMIRALCRSDLGSVADVHLRAFSDRALASLGREAVRRYYEWQLQGPHDAIALGFFHDERLAGFCFAGVFHGALSGFLRRNRRFLTWCVITHPWLMATPLFRERMKLAWNALRQRSVSVTSQPITPAKSFGILAIAVDPQLQGAGLGQQLMAETEKIAVERGFSHLHLTVAISNQRATGFYQSLGWQKLCSSDGVWKGSMVKKLPDLDV